MQAFASVALKEQCLAPAKAAPNACLDYATAIAFTKPSE
jgi:hypothetical protein